MWQCERKYIVMIITLLHHDVLVVHVFINAPDVTKTLRGITKKIKQYTFDEATCKLDRLKQGAVFRSTGGRMYTISNHPPCYLNTNHTPADITDKHNFYPTAQHDTGRCILFDVVDSMCAYL